MGEPQTDYHHTKNESASVKGQGRGRKGEGTDAEDTMDVFARVALLGVVAGRTLDGDLVAGSDADERVGAAALALCVHQNVNLRRHGLAKADARQSSQLWSEEYKRSHTLGDKEEDTHWS